MERNNPMVIIYKLSFMLILFFISSCKEPHKEYFIGKWTSSDCETVLHIKSDGSFVTEKFIINTVNDKTKRIDGKGMWRIFKFSNTFRLELIFYEPEIDCNIYFDYRDNTYKKQLHSEELFIGRHIFFGLNKPWYCYQVIGNEDNEKWVVFTKNKPCCSVD